MSFTLKLENSRILKGIIETLASIIDETEFRVTPKEFTISAMDPSRICLLKLSIKKDDFDDYQCSKESKKLGWCVWYWFIVASLNWPPLTSGGLF